MQANLETLFIFLAFIAISAFSAWLQRRRQSQEEGSWPEGPPPGYEEPPHSRVGHPVGPANEPQPASPVSSWEQELRRLLEGVRPSPTESPKPPPFAPPVQSSASRPPRPVPPPLISPPGSATAVSATPVEDTSWALRQARARQADASRRLREAKARTASQLRGVAGRQTDIARLDLASARRLLSSPRSARQVIIASTILGNPKALQ